MSGFLRVLGVSLIVLGLITGPGREVASAGTGSTAGEDLAKKKCSACHAIGAEGASKLTKATPLREFAAKTSPDKLQSGIEAALKKGHWGVAALTAAELKELTGYIEQLKSQRKSQLEYQGGAKAEQIGAVGNIDLHHGARRPNPVSGSDWQGGGRFA